MRPSTTVIALLAVCALLLCLALGLPSQSAMAHPGSAESCVYYSDATHTHQVGSCLFKCFSVSCMGTQTSFFTCRNLGSC